MTHGHPNVYMLDGNFNEWLKHDYPFTIDNNPTTKVVPQAADYAYVDVGTETRCGVEDLLAGVRNKDTIFVDAREPPQFAAKPSDKQKFAHIPGAISLYSGRLLGPNATIRLQDDLLRVCRKEGKRAVVIGQAFSLRRSSSSTATEG